MGTSSPLLVSSPIDLSNNSLMEGMGSNSNNSNNNILKVI